MTTSEFIDLYLDLFDGQRDYYAIWIDGKKGKRGMYVPSDFTPRNEKGERWKDDVIDPIVDDIGTERYGPQAVKAHLMGDHFLGVYPLQADSTSKFFALDFDKDKEEAWAEAKRQQEIFLEQAGLPTYIERSRSGNGFHLWGFLEDPVDGGVLRHALGQFIEDADTYDRMFPHQNSLNENRTYGNLIALPLYGPGVLEGNGVFVEVDRQGRPLEIEDQKEFLSNAELIPPDTIQDLFEGRPDEYDPSQYESEARAEPPGELTGSYKAVSPEFGCQWLRWAYEHAHEVSEPAWYALACQFAQFEDGRKLFHEWSAQAPDMYDPVQTDMKFDQALRVNAPHSCEYIRDNNLGPGCYCDQRFPDKGVYHPFDLAKLTVTELVDSLGTDEKIKTGSETLIQVVDWLGQVQDDPNLGKGLPFGIEPIDKVTGLRGGDLVIIGGRPGMGKTAFAIDVACRLAESNHPVYFFSIEMQARMLGLRMLCWLTELDSKKALTGRLSPDDWALIDEKARWVQENDFPFFIDDVSRDSRDIVDLAGDLRGEHGKGVVFIDYLQLTSALPGEAEYDKVTRVVQEYRASAKILDMPVVALAQLNRDADDATSQSQTFDRWLRNSGQIEQDAAIIAYLLGEKAPGSIVPRTFAVHKDRHMGAGHRIDLQFNKASSKFGAPGTWNFSSSDRHAGGSEGSEERFPVITDRDALYNQIVGGNADMFGGLD